jgi:predicted transcriptional regulator of viral defense system
VSEFSHNETLLIKSRDASRALGVFRTRDFVAAGYPREYLRRLLKAEQVCRISPGLYTAADFDGDHNISLVEAAKRVPRGVVCLASALQFHRIGTQSPHQVWLALPRGTKPPRGPMHQLRLCTFSPASHAYGVEAHPLSGGTVRVFSPAKTVADCFKYRSKHGLDMAVEALREGWRDKRFTLAEITAAAEVCRVRRIIQPYLEMLT